MPLPLQTPMQTPSRLLLVKLSALGDVACTLPLLEALREGLGPNVFIGWAVKSAFAPLLTGNPHLNQVYQLQSKNVSGLRALGKTLRAADFDTALDAQGLLVSGVLTRTSCAPVRIGLDNNREGNRFFLTKAVVPSRQREHMVSKLLGFCDALNIPRVSPRPQTYLTRPTEASHNALAYFGAGVTNAPLVGCIVGASTPDKTWPALKWAELVRLLINDGINVLLLGGKNEMEAAQQIQNEIGESRHLRNLAGQTGDLRDLAALLAACDTVIGGDSGPTHLAAAVGTPVVGLYGVTDPVRTGPQWGSAPALVLDFAEADAPPALRRPRHSALPDAISRIPVRAVYDAAVSLISADKPAAKEAAA